MIDRYRLGPSASLLTFERRGDRDRPHRVVAGFGRLVGESHPQHAG